MRCPFCGYEDQKVLESRVAREGNSIRRRRECLQCERRFTTFEEPESPRVFVVKRDGSRQEFDRRKVFESIRVACGKRPVSTETIHNLARDIECEVLQGMSEEVESTELGRMVMAKLEQTDEVAYVRFASVYLSFEGLDDFKKMLSGMGHAATPV